MKVLLVNTFDGGGAGIACIRLHLALLQQGVDSYLLTLHKSRNDIPNHLVYDQLVPKAKPKSFLERQSDKIVDKLTSRNKKNKAKNDQIKDLLNQASKDIDCFTLIKTDYRIDLIPDIDSYDCINLHWVGYFLDWETFFSSPKIKKVVWTLHDMHAFTGGYHYSQGYEGYKTDDKNPPFLKNTFDPAFAHKQLQQKQEILKRSKVDIHIIGLSNWLLNCSKESSVFKSYPHYLIPNGIDVNIFKTFDKNFCKSIFDIPSNKKMILFVMDNINNKRKGFQILAEGLKDITNPDVILCSIGKNIKMELPDSMHKHLGSISDERLMAIAYNAADIFIQPSLEDNLPNVVVEALCCGTPVIGFSIGGMIDMIQNGKNGYIAEKKNSEALLQLVNKLIDELDNFDRESISLNATSKYKSSVQSSAYIKMFKGLSDS